MVGVWWYNDQPMLILWLRIVAYSRRIACNDLGYVASWRWAKLAITGMMIKRTIKMPPATIIVRLWRISWIRAKMRVESAVCASVDAGACGNRLAKVHRQWDAGAD